jgi:glycosyltransferase involved in cell wall biosynthesis
MRVGIYNRWLATLGGGEKYNLTIAEHLSKRHTVQVISHKKVSKELAEERLGLDLSRVEFLTIPDRSPIEISPLTSAYDLFVNASHLDYFPSYAKYSANVVYFPAKLSRVIAAYRKLKMIARQQFKLPAVMTGIQAFEVTPQSFRWVAETPLTIRLPASVSAYTCSFGIKARDGGPNGVSFFLDGARVGERSLSLQNLPVRIELPVPATVADSHHELKLYSEPDGSQEATPTIEIFDLELSLPQFRLYQTLFERWFKGVGVRLQFYPPGNSILDYLETYKQIWSISQFTTRWIKTYWRRKSEVLYPPVNVEDFHPGEKQPRILNVGRFFAGNHNKKHLEMARAFRELVDQGLQGWEFHMAGGRTPGAEHEGYLAQVHQAAAGYPIVIHPDIDPGELSELYSSAALYWHASGYGEDERQDPDKSEHFGITTVEAMAAGCVPLVIGKGGQPEIVVHASSGYLWNNLEQLKTQTIQLSRDEPLRSQMGLAAQLQSQRYGKNNFYNRLDQLLEMMDFPIS